MKVLLVEDEADIREALKLILEGAGYEAIEAEDGEQAVEKFINSDCSVVLLDWLLPGISGLEVARRMKDIRYVYIIMVTGKAKEENAAKAVEVGVRDYLQKPFNPFELIECVDVASAIIAARELLRKRFERLGVDVEIVNQYL